MSLENVVLGKTIGVLNTQINFCYVGELIIKPRKEEELGKENQVLTLENPAVFDPEKGIKCQGEYTIAHNLIEVYIIPAELKARLKKLLPENTIVDTYLNVVMKNDVCYRRPKAREKEYLKLEIIGEDSDGKNTS